jgi:hypothetical protein
MKQSYLLPSENLLLASAEIEKRTYQLFEQSLP